MTPQTRGFFLSTALSDRLSTHFIDNSPYEEDLTRVRGTISPIGACSTASLLTRPLPVKGDRTWKEESGMDERHLIVSVADIESRIFFIRGQKVMLDRDLANLYGVETRVLNQAVRRNIRRFPQDFMLSLTREEIMDLSRIVTSSGIKHAPNVFVFTEQSVAMLSGELNSQQAIQVNIAIMRVL